MEEEWKRVGGLEHGWREGRGGVDKGVDEGFGKGWRIGGGRWRCCGGRVEEMWKNGRGWP